MSDLITTCATGCDRPSHGYYLCAHCTHALVGDLRRVGELVRQLETTITRQTRNGTGIGVTSQPSERPLPVNLTAAEVRADLGNVLTTWARDIRGRTGADGDVDSITAAAAYLVANVSTLRTHPAADELHDEITDAIARAWRVVDRPAERRFVGPCDQCSADMYARPHDAEHQCAECGTVYDADERRAWLVDQARDQIETASTIARALPGLLGQNVTPAMIRGYVHRGRLLARPPDAAGRARFRVGDVIDLVMST